MTLMLTEKKDITPTDLFLRWHIQRHSRSWNEYRRAKNLFMAGEYEMDYQGFVAALVEWVEL